MLPCSYHTYCCCQAKCQCSWTYCFVLQLDSSVKLKIGSMADIDTLTIYLCYIVS